MGHRILVVGVRGSQGSELQAALWRIGLDLVRSEPQGPKAPLASIDALVADLSLPEVAASLSTWAPPVPVVPFDTVDSVVASLEDRFGRRTLELSGATVDLPASVATRPDGEKVSLTANETALLRFLAAHLDEVVSEQELLRRVLGYAPGVRSRAVSSSIYRLRQKVEADPKSPVNLLSEYGRGYRLTLPTTAGPQLTLPMIRDGFVGRARELDLVNEAVLARPLVTLTGPGGIGKSRLMLEVAHRVQARSSSRVVWVGLADARTPDAATASVVAALGFVPTTAHDERGLLRALVASGELLLCLDDCDGVLESLAPRMSRWLDACPQLHVLVTARRPTNVHGERQILLQPLSLPETASSSAVLDSEAVELLLRRIQDRDVSFRVNDHNAAALARIAHMVDGLPLGLELAAGRAAFLPIECIAANLETSSESLESDEIGRPSRHRSLGATLRWSWDHDPPEDQRVLGALSVFAGGFTLDAAEAVVEASADLATANPARSRGSASTPDLASQRSGYRPLASRDASTASFVHRLVAKGWVRRRPEGRFELLRTVREFVEATVDAETRAAVQRRHRAFFEAEPDWPVAEEKNLVAACETALQNEDPTLRKLFTTTWYVLRRTGAFTKMASLGRRALRLPLTVETRARLGRIVGAAQVLAGDVPAARETFDRAIAAASESGDRALLGRALNSRATAAWPDEPELAWRLFDEALELAEELQDPVGIHQARQNLAILHTEEGRFDEALAIYDDYLTRSDAATDRPTILQCLGTLHGRRGDFAEAKYWQEQALRAFEQSGDRLGQISALYNLGLVAIDQEDFESGHERLTASIDLARDAGNQRWLGKSLGLRGMALLERRRFREARTDLREALTLVRISGTTNDQIFVLLRLAELFLTQKRPHSVSVYLDEAAQLSRGIRRTDVLADLLVEQAAWHVHGKEAAIASERLAVATRWLDQRVCPRVGRIARRFAHVQRELEALG